MPISFGRFTINGTNMPSDTPAGYSQGNYESDVYLQFESLLKHDSSRVILSSFQHNVEVVPTPSISTCNAFAAPNSRLDASPLGKTLSNCTTGTQVPGFQGTGVGTDVTLPYFPGNWISSSTVNCGFTGPGSGPDELLMHELIHAMRQSRGLLSCETPPGLTLTRYDTVAEFVAITITNVYISEKLRRQGKPKDVVWSSMRRDHQDFQPMMVLEAMDFNSFPENHHMIERMFVEMKEICEKLAEVAGWFNPFFDRQNKQVLELFKSA